MILHMDNFSIYGNVDGYMLNGVYAQVSDCDVVNDPSGAAGSALYLRGNNANNHDGVRYVLQTSGPKLGICQRMWLPSLPANNGDPKVLICQWRNGANSNLLTLTVDSTGRLSLLNGDYNAAILGTTTNPVVTANGWFHLESIFDDTTNSFECRVEGLTVLNVAAIAAKGDTAQIFIGQRTSLTGATKPWYTKDLVIYNGAGTYNTTFMGSVIVKDLIPIADVNTNWNTTGPDRFSILDNRPPNDAAFITAINPPPAAYVAELSDLPPDVTSVKGLMIFVRAAKNDGGDGWLQNGLISDPLGTPATALGADRPITVAQTYWRDVIEEDPVTSAPWTPNAVDLVQLQINRTL